MKHLNLWSVLAGLIALVWIIVSIMSLCQEKCLDILIITHSIFLVLFTAFIILSYKTYKMDSESQLKKEEYERKEQWEKFEYELCKEERIENKNYERVERLVNQLKDKKIVEENKLKEEFKTLQQDFESLKLENEKKIFLELSKFK